MRDYAYRDQLGAFRRATQANLPPRSRPHTAKCATARRGSEFLLTCLCVDRRLICVRADSLGMPNRKDQEGEEQRCCSARNHGNASAAKTRPTVPKIRGFSNGFQSSPTRAETAGEDRHRQRDETCLRAAQAWTALQPLGKSVEHTVSHQTECPVAQIRDSLVEGCSQACGYR